MDWWQATKDWLDGLLPIAIAGTIGLVAVVWSARLAWTGLRAHKWLLPLTAVVFWAALVVFLATSDLAALDQGPWHAWLTNVPFVLSAAAAGMLYVLARVYATCPQCGVFLKTSNRSVFQWPYSYATVLVECPKCKSAAESKASFGLGQAMAVGKLRRGLEEQRDRSVERILSEIFADRAERDRFRQWAMIHCSEVKGTEGVLAAVKQGDGSQLDPITAFEHNLISAEDFVRRLQDCLRQYASESASGGT
jgi:hypothetical protein